MKTLKTGHSGLSQKNTTRFLVLVPHRDARLPLRKWSGALFEAGLYGAWSFPWVSPLALLEKPFSDEALKRLARALRELVENNGGKFVCTRTGCIDFSGTSASAAVFGPALDMEIPDLFYPPCLAGNILRRFSPLVLGAALLHNKQPPPALSAFPPLSFRAAALANMSCRPLDGNGMENPYSLEWKIGALRWLPAAGKTKS